MTNKTIIIGGGLMGSAAAWQLSKQGVEVLLLEQQSQIYTSGSSFGEARITRSLGPKGDIFAYLQKISTSETIQLIAYLNENDPERNHTIDEIFTTSPVTYIYYGNQQDQFDALIKTSDLDLKVAQNPKECKRVFGMKMTENQRVIREYETYSGAMNPRLVIEKLHLAIKLKGGEVRYNQRISGIVKNGDRYQFDLKDLKSTLGKQVKCENLIIAAGAYTGKLVASLNPEFQKWILPKRVFLSFLTIATSTYNRFTEVQKKQLRDGFPVVDFSSELIFAMIEKEENDQPILKIGAHYLRSKIQNMDEVWTQEVTENEIAWSKKRMLSYLHMLNLPVQLNDLEFHKGSSCVYSLTSTEIPYVTNIQNQNNREHSCVLIAGMSGIGTKSALGYGLIAANLITQGLIKNPIYQKAKKALSIDRDDSNPEVQNTFRAD